MINRIEFHAMGSCIKASVDCLPGCRDASVFLAQIPKAFEDWEMHLSRFRPESELSRLNRAQGVPTEVSKTFWKALQAALRAEVQSGGLVSAAVLDAVMSAGYTDSFERLASDAPGSSAPAMLAGPVLSLRSIKLDSEKHSLRLPVGMHLDFGGVGKGWAAQQAMRLLEPCGPTLVDAGGDIAVSGLRRGGEPWLIAVEDPRRPGQNLGMIRMGRGGVATSGVDYRRWRQGGQWRHHIIDPRSGSPAETDILSVTVIAPGVMEAEMAAKVVLISGSREGMAWLSERPDFAGLAVLQNGSVLRSEALRCMEVADVDFKVG